MMADLPQVTIAYNGALTLLQSGTVYEVSSGSTLEATLELSGLPISSGQFGAYNPIALEAIVGGGYEVMWRDATTDTFIGLDFDAGGNFTSAATAVLAGSSYALQSLERGFADDLNSDGSRGPMTSTIYSGPFLTQGEYPASAHSVLQVADEYEVVTDSFANEVSSQGYTYGAVTETSVILTVSGSPIVSGQFHGFVPAFVTQPSGGFEVVFKSGTSFIGLDFNSSGNYLSAATSLLAGSSYALESLELGLGYDLNGDGTTGLASSTIAVNGPVALVSVADEFEIISGAAMAQILTYSGSPIISGRFGGFTPDGVLASGGGYEVMFQSGSSFIALNVDSAGNLTSAATSLLAGGSYALESLENTFGVDLNGDGTTGLTSVTLDEHPFPESPGYSPYARYLITVADQYEINFDTFTITGYDHLTGGLLTTSAVASSFLTLSGAPMTSEQLGGYTPVYVTQGPGPFDVVFKGDTKFIELNFDSGGHYASAATGILAGNSLALENLESSLDDDLNGDGTIGVLSTTIATNGALNLVGLADEFEITSGGTVQAILQINGSPIISGQFAGYTPQAVTMDGAAFEIMFSSGASFVALDFNTKGAYLSAATGILTSGSYALESLEPGFNADLNGDGTIGPNLVPIEAALALDATSPVLNLAGNAFEITSGAQSAVLLVSSKPIISGQFFGFTAEAVIANTGGYEVMFNSDTSFIGLDFDSAGNFLSAATGVLTSGSFALHVVERQFGYDLDGDGNVGPIEQPIQYDSGQYLFQEDNVFVIQNGKNLPGISQASWAVLQISGSPIISGHFNGFDPIGLLSNFGGYEVMFNSATGFIGLEFDISGNYLSADTGLLAGSSYALESQETAFGNQYVGGDDLNGDGVIGVTSTVIATNGALNLVGVADEFEITSGGAVQGILQINGRAIISGQFGGFTPQAVTMDGAAFEIMFSSGASFVALDFNTNGAYLSAVTGLLASGSYALESLERGFNVDLNGDGTIGPNLVVIESPVSLNAITPVLNLAGNVFEITSGPQSAVLLVSSKPIISGQFFGFTAEAVIANAGSYEVMFNSANSFIGLDFDTSGHELSAATGVLTSGTYALHLVEQQFGYDLDHNGVVGPMQSFIGENGPLGLFIEDNLFVIEDHRLADDNGNVSQTVLRISGAPIMSGQFAGFNPLAVLSNAGGYEVMFNSATGFIGLEFDTSGNFLSADTALLAGSSTALESLETEFATDLNGDGLVGLPQSAIQTDNGTTLTLVAFSSYYLYDAQGSGPELQVNSVPVSSGQLGTINPIGAVAVTGGGYEVAFKDTASDTYIVWAVNSAGNYTSLVTGPVTGQDFSLEQLEPVFGQDLNGDGRLSTQVLSTQVSSGLNTLSLTQASPATTVQLANNTAYAGEGLGRFTFTLTGTPATLVLTSATATIDISLQKTLGIEVISGYQYGLDQLNIDLKGAASSVLTVGSGTYDNQAAITLFSLADPTHGVILVGYGTMVTSDSVPTNHTTFIGGHAVIT